MGKCMWDTTYKYFFYEDYFYSDFKFEAILFIVRCALHKLCTTKSDHFKAERFYTEDVIEQTQYMIIQFIEDRKEQESVLMTKDEN